MPTPPPPDTADPTAAAALADPLPASAGRQGLSVGNMLLIGLLALIWGSSFILMKRGITQFTPIEIGALRMVSAGLFMVPFGLMRLHQIKRRHVPHMVLAGLIGSFFPAFLFATAATYLDSAISGSLNALSPLFTLLVGVAFYGTRTGWKGYLGILLGLVGALALTLRKVGDDASLNAWALLVVLATILYAININHLKRSLHDADPVAITSVSFIPLAVLGAIVLAFTPFPHRIGMSGFFGVPLASIITLGVMGSAVSWVLYNRLLKQTSALTASTVTYLMPVVSLAWGVWDGEHLLAWHYLGLALVLGGLGLVAMSGRGKR